MGASRKSYSLQSDLKDKNYKRFWKNLRTLLYLRLPEINYKNRKKFSNSRYERKVIITDSFVTPFNKKFGCKWFGHNWKFDEEDNYYVCWKCFKYEKPDVYKAINRDDKIDKILR